MSIMVVLAAAALASLPAPAPVRASAQATATIRVIRGVELRFGRDNPGAPPARDHVLSGQTVNVTAQNVQFDTSSINVNAGGQVRIHFTNNDNGTPHNFAVYKSSTDTTPVADGSVGVIFPGPNVDDVVFTTPAAGSYYFRCDVHPTIMFGTFTVK